MPLVQDGGGWSTRITLTNLAAKPGVFIIGFMSAKGFAEPWKLQMTSTSGRVSSSVVELNLEPGATAVIETSGSPAEMQRGFAEIVEFNDQPFGAVATLIQKAGEQRVQAFELTPTAGHERRSVMPLDLRDPLRPAELVFVSVTSSVVLEVTFRDLAGKVVHTDRIDLEGNAQISVNVSQRWQQLQNFRGTMQWAVTFPFADRYESRTLSGVQVLLNADGQASSVVTGMTLLADQASVNPY